MPSTARIAPGGLIHHVLNRGVGELTLLRPRGDDNSAVDPLDRLVAFSRGTLSSSGNNGAGLDTVATANDNDETSIATQDFALNAVGDQSSVTTDGTATTNATNSQNQLTSVGSNSLAYDENGNTTADSEGQTLVYDAWNRLVAVDLSGLPVATYTYDGAGRRITETENGATSDEYFSNQWQVLEQRVSGVTTQQYVFGPFYVNQIVERDDNGGTGTGDLGIANSGLNNRVYVQQDANWNVTALTNADGTVINHFVYSAYGIATVLNADWMPDPTATFGDGINGWQYGFQGGRYDPASGLVNFQHRDYDANTGTWREQDPIGYVDGAGTYGVNRGNPASNVDPFGLSAIDLLHDTRLERAMKIAREGFKPGIDDLIWFRDPTAALGGTAKWVSLRPVQLTLRMDIPILPLAQQTLLDEGARFASSQGLAEQSPLWWGEKWNYVLEKLGSDSDLGFVHGVDGGLHYALTEEGLAQASPTLVGATGPGSESLIGAISQAESLDTAGLAGTDYGLAAASFKSVGSVTLEGVSGAVSFLLIAERYTLHTCVNAKVNHTGYMQQLRQDISDDLRLLGDIFKSLYITRVPYGSNGGA